MDASPDAARRLLAWYERVRRPLPWRVGADPYRVWLSEVMLQQTRVDVVAPRYARFLARFPDVGALAAASEEEVLAEWSGLGYYRRARQLHAAARRVAAAGGFPGTAAGLAELPGVGAYTAAAVASIAFGEAVPVLDGNVERVLSRYLASDADPKRGAGRRALLAAAAAFLLPGRAGDANQALMELGATVCRPRRPRCGECPLVPGCRGLAAGDPERYPPPRRRRAVERHELVVAVARRRGRVLLFRRPDTATLLGGTWELPWAERASTAAVEQALAGRYGGRWRLAASCGRVRHGITHRDLALDVHPARVAADGAVAEAVEAAWVAPAELPRYPASSLVGKALACYDARRG